MIVRRSFSLLILLLTVSLGACDSSEDDDFSLNGTILSMSDIAGTWNATRANFSRSADGPALAVELVSQGGSATLVIQSNGRFTFTTTLPGEAPTVTTGQLGFDEDLLVVIFVDDPDDFEFFGIQLSGNTLSLNGQGTYDFDNGDGEIAAHIELELVRG